MSSSYTNTQIIDELMTYSENYANYVDHVCHAERSRIVKLLQSLPDDQVKVIVAIMEIGRGRYRAFDREVRRSRLNPDSTAIRIDMLLAKVTALYGYFETARMILKKKKRNIDKLGCAPKSTQIDEDDEADENEDDEADENEDDAA